MILSDRLLERHPLAAMSGRRARIAVTVGRHHLAFMAIHALIILGVVVVVGALVFSIPAMPPPVAIAVLAAAAGGAGYIVSWR
jgi:hypothetical protein